MVFVRQLYSCEVIAAVQASLQLVHARRVVDQGVIEEDTPIVSLDTAWVSVGGEG